MGGGKGQREGGREVEREKGREAGREGGRAYLVVKVWGTVWEVAVGDEDVQALVRRELGHPALDHFLEDKPERGRVAGREAGWEEGRKGEGVCMNHTSFVSI